MGSVALAALISGVVALAGTAISAGLSKQQSEENIAAQKEFNDSQTLSAKIAEAKENGISPLAVLGQNATSAVVSAPQANADYSGFSNFGNSLMNSITGFSKEKYSTDVKSKTDVELQRMKNKNAEDIANLEINSNEKQTLQSLNNALAIANNKNATDKEIQNSINVAQHNLEMLRSSNSEFLQNKQILADLNELKMNLEQAQKEDYSKSKRAWFDRCFNLLGDIIKTAGNVFGSVSRM